MMKRLTMLCFLLAVLCACAYALMPLPPPDIQIASRDHVVVASLVVKHTNLWAKVWSGGWTNVTESERDILFGDMRQPHVHVSEVLKGSLSNGVHAIRQFAGMPVRDTNGTIRIRWDDMRWSTPPSATMDQPCLWFLSVEKTTNGALPGVDGVWHLAPLEEKGYWALVLERIKTNPPALKQPKDDGYWKWWEEEIKKQQGLKEELLEKGNSPTKESTVQK